MGAVTGAAGKVNPTSSVTIPNAASIQISWGTSEAFVTMYGPAAHPLKSQALSQKHPREGCGEECQWVLCGGYW